MSRPKRAKKPAKPRRGPAQAALVAENSRLRGELAEAREQQTATGGILRVISQSLPDIQPVFDAIARSAVQLCDGLVGSVFRFDGDLMCE